MRFYRKVIPFILILILLVSAVSAESYSIQDERRYVVRNAYQIKNDGAKEVYNLNIKVLAGSDTDSYYQKNLAFNISPFPSSLSTDEWGNTYAHINIKELKPGQKIDVIVDREILNGGISYNKSIYGIKADYKDFLSNPSNYKYILPGEKIESDNPQIKAKALELTKTGTIVEKAKKIYDFVNLHIKYDATPNYANKGALSGFITGRGVCDEYASLFTALCRAAGIPSRVVEGYWLEDEVKENKWTDVSDRRHSWSEFYLPGEGWIPVEPTFIYTYNGKRVPNENYFANIGAEDKHLITSYMSNPIINDIDVQYSYYESDSVGMKLISGEESIMLLPKDSEGSSKKSLTDIEGNWAKDYIQKLYEADVVLPREGSMYKPGENITRAEFAAYLAKAIGLKEIEGAGNYRDVSSSNPYAGYIEAASKAGLIQGYNGYFYPEYNITRQDAAVIMERALKFLGKNQVKGSLVYSFADSKDISDYATDAVKLMYELNIMSGKPGNLFAPKDFTTRGEAAKIIWTFMGLL
ncbi:S-layer homology domain-containing protein [Lutispora sp.]|uniref:S-layer homology domain-containing protein n=1 Tax=Lutispora sp. TaxID=2828727 RepID=UPI0035689533